MIGKTLKVLESITINLNQKLPEEITKLILDREKKKSTKKKLQQI